MPSLGNDTYEIQIKTVADNSGANSASESLSKVKGHTEEAGKSAGESEGKFGALWEKFAVGELVAQGVEHAFESAKEGISSVIEAANNDQAAMSQMAGVIKSTGDASQLSAEEQEKYAESISATTPTTKQAVMAGENMISTFTNIKGQAFEGATAAANNMATFFNQGVAPTMQQMSQQAMMVGKALNDPATGYAKLQREGVTFDKQQIQQIKTMEAAGNMAGAQAVMLQELQKEFGGAGQAASTTFAGGLQMVKNNLEELKVQVGEDFMSEFAGVFQKLGPMIEELSPVIKQLGGTFADIADQVIGALPTLFQVLNAVLQIASALAPALGPIIAIVSSFALDLAKLLLPVIQALTPLIGDLAGVFSTLENVFAGLIQAALPILVPLVKDIVSAFHTLEPALEIVINALGDAFIAILKSQQPIMPVIAMAITAIAKAFAQVIVDLTPLIPVLAQLITQIIGALIPYLPVLINSFLQLLPAILQLLPPLVQIITAILPILIDLVKIVIPPVAMLAELFSGVLAGALRLVISIFAAVIQTIAGVDSAILGVVGKVMNAVSGFSTMLYSAGQDLIRGLINGINHMVGDVGSAVEGVAKGAVSKVKGLLGIHSPSVVFHEIGQNVGQGMVNGIASMQGDVGNAAGNLAGAALGSSLSAQGMSVTGGAGSYGSPSSNVSAGSSNTTNNNNNGITVQQVTIQAPNGATFQSIMQSLNRDVLVTGKGLASVSGAN